MSHARAAGRGGPQHGQPEVGLVLSVRDLAKVYVIVGVSGGELVARRKSDGLAGTLRFRHRPTVIFGFRLLPVG